MTPWRQTQPWPRRRNVHDQLGDATVILAIDERRNQTK
jgi:hypothetical protein